MHRRWSWQERLGRVFDGLVCVVAFIVLAFLAGSCVLYHAYVDNPEIEHVALRWNIAAPIQCGAIALLLLLVARGVPARLNRWLEQGDRLARCEGICIAVTVIIVAVWVRRSWIYPRADQQIVLDSAWDLLEGDDTIFQPLEYMDRYSHQSGLLLYETLLVWLIGPDAFVAIQLLNAIALAIVAKESADLGAQLGVPACLQLALSAIGLWFWPLIIYCSFVYGTLWSLAFSLLAMRLEVQLIVGNVEGGEERGRRTRHAAADAEEGESRRDSSRSALAGREREGRRRWSWPALVGSGLSIALAIVFKQNSLVVAIAMGIVAVVGLMRRPGRIVQTLVVLAISVAAATTIPLAALRAVSDQPLDHPMSSWNYIAMGMREGGLGDHSKAPGWYDGYNVEIYRQAEGDADLQRELAMDVIGERLATFAGGPLDAGRFYAEKTLTQWTLPTFQAYWNIQTMLRDQEINFSISPQPWVEDVIGPPAEARANWVLETVLIGIYGFAAVALATMRRRDAPLAGVGPLSLSARLLLATAFLGGFLCHLLWEAKAQYAISYFVMLAPYAALGFTVTARRLSRLFGRRGRRAGRHLRR